MSKRILGRHLDGQGLWIAIPDIAMRHRLKKPYSYLDVFYYFAQFLFSPPSEMSAHEAMVLKKDFVQRAMLELENKLFSFQYLSKQLIKKEKTVVAFLMLRERKIYDSRPLQEYLTFLDAVLNALDGLCDQLRAIDSLLKEQVFTRLINEHWFQRILGTRHLLHHVLSPQVIARNDKAYIQCYRFEKLHKRNIMRMYKQLRVQLRVAPEMLLPNVLKLLNRGAELYLEKIDKGVTLDFVTGLRKDGGINAVQKSLGEILTQ